MRENEDMYVGVILPSMQEDLARKITIEDFERELAEYDAEKADTQEREVIPMGEADG